MKCDICGMTVDTIQEAIDLDWIPYFYEDKIEHGPVCCSCAEKSICVGEDGELELKEEYRGKITYQGGNYLYEEPKEHLVIGIMLSNTEEGINN